VGPESPHRKMARTPEDEEGPIGVFPSWRWVYGAVLVYGTLVIVALWILSRVMDPGGQP
jgi:hypothetical protein